MSFFCQETLIKKPFRPNNLAFIGAVMKRTLLAIICICIVVAILSPIASRIYFSSALNDASESYELQISDLQQENTRLWQEIEQLNERNEGLKDPYFKESFLVTELGWYLHGSTDLKEYSRNKFTIYGKVYNVGATNATNCKLIVNLYDNLTLLQQSEIDLGTINYWSHEYVRKDIDCEIADSVTRIEVERTWRNIS